MRFNFNEDARSSVSSLRAQLVAQVLEYHAPLCN